MLPILISISHIARPVSLSMCLMGNIVGDHKLVLVFFGVFLWLNWLIFMVSGALVCVAQAVRTTVYMSQALAYEGALEEHERKH